jgi:hypothetical protein
LPARRYHLQHQQSLFAAQRFALLGDQPRVLDAITA